MEHKEERSALNLHLILFTVILAAAVLWIIFSSEIAETGWENIRAFSDAWTSGDGSAVSLGNSSSGRMILKKRLPGNLAAGDCICFESRDTEFVLTVEERILAEHKPEKNISGAGMGKEFNVFPLKPSDGGRWIQLEYSGVYENGGFIREAYISPAVSYICMSTVQRVGTALMSLLIAFLGMVMLIIYIRIPDKEDMPFNILALGFVAVIAGIWLFGETGIMQITTGRRVLYRAVDRILPVFEIYPFICFINSVTKKKRRIYEATALWVDLALAAVYIGMTVAGIADMGRSFGTVIVFGLIFLILFSVLILSDNFLYCSSNATAPALKEFYPGIAAFAVCALADLVSTFILKLKFIAVGSFTRLGTVLFLFMSLFQFLRWWTRNREGIERDRFINRAMQYAISSVSPDESIRAMLAYMGSELKVGRIGIFEEHENGKYHGSYEWYREGLLSVGLDMIYLPYEGFIDELDRAFAANNKCLIVEDPEEYKNVYPALYNLLKSHNVNNMISGALESGGRLLGVLTFFNAPEDYLEEISEIILLISYFLSQLIMQREEQNRLRFYSYNDQISGALNRAAYNEYVENGLDETLPFGYIICNIDNLGDTNDTGGYEEGDRTVRTMVGIMKDIFGEKNVYRLSGAEFTAFGFETDEGFFDGDVQRVRKAAAAKGIDISLGSVYCANGTMGMERVIRRADGLLRSERNKKLNVRSRSC